MPRERAGVLGGAALGVEVLEVQPVLLQVLQAVARAVDARGIPQVVQVQPGLEVRLGHRAREDLAQGELLEDRLGDRQIDRLGVVRRDVRVLFALRVDEVLEVEPRHANDLLPLEPPREAALEELIVHQLAHQRRRDPRQARSQDLLLDRRRHLPGRGRVKVGLLLEGLGNAALVPLDERILGAGIHEEREVGRAAAALPRHLAHGHGAAGLVAPVAIDDIRLRRLGMAGLDQNLLDHILDILDAGDVSFVVSIEVIQHGARQLFGDESVFAPHGLRGLENRVGDLGLIKRHDTAVTLPNVCDALRHTPLSLPVPRPYLAPGSPATPGS